MYKLIKNFRTDEINAVLRLSDNAFIPFDPANTDYANFKDQIISGEAELQDAEGNTMTAQDAQAFVATLP